MKKFKNYFDLIQNQKMSLTLKIIVYKLKE